MIHFLSHKTRRTTLRVAILIALAMLGYESQAQIVVPSLAEALRQPGHIILMRHSLAPGSGDPGDFDLRDCSTQRNLNDEGREQAARAGQALRDLGVEVAAVYSGRWCRNLETARLLGLGEVQEAPAFDSQQNLGPTQAEQGREFLAGLPRDGSTVIVVTHSSNIRGLTGESVSSGEILVLRLADDGGYEVLGSLGTL